MFSSSKYVKFASNNFKTKVRRRMKIRKICKRIAQIEGNAQIE